jgi:hypothetical protein
MQLYGIIYTLISLKREQREERKGKEKKKKKGEKLYLFNK